MKTPKISPEVHTPINDEPKKAEPKKTYSGRIYQFLTETSKGRQTLRIGCLALATLLSIAMIPAIIACSGAAASGVGLPLAVTMTLGLTAGAGSIGALLAFASVHNHKAQELAAQNH